MGPAPQKAPRDLMVPGPYKALKGSMGPIGSHGPRALKGTKEPYGLHRALRGTKEPYGPRGAPWAPWAIYSVTSKWHLLTGSTTNKNLLYVYIYIYMYTYIGICNLVQYI
jgi:hypothetical protein